MHPFAKNTAGGASIPAKVRKWQIQGAAGVKVWRLGDNSCIPFLRVEYCMEGSNETQISTWEPLFAFSPFWTPRRSQPPELGGVAANHDAISHWTILTLAKYLCTSVPPCVIGADEASLQLCVKHNFITSMPEGGMPMGTPAPTVPLAAKDDVVDFSFYTDSNRIGLAWKTPDGTYKYFASEHMYHAGIQAMIRRAFDRLGTEDMTLGELRTAGVDDRFIDESYIALMTAAAARRADTSRSGGGGGKHAPSASSSAASSSSAGAKKAVAGQQQQQFASASSSNAGKEKAAVPSSTSSSSSSSSAAVGAPSSGSRAMPGPRVSPSASFSSTHQHHQHLSSQSLTVVNPRSSQLALAAAATPAASFPDAITALDSLYTDMIDDNAWRLQALEDDMAAARATERAQTEEQKIVEETSSAARADLARLVQTSAVEPPPPVQNSAAALAAVGETVAAAQAEVARLRQEVEAARAANAAAAATLTEKETALGASRATNEELESQVAYFKDILGMNG